MLFFSGSAKFISFLNLINPVQDMKVDLLFLFCLISLSISNPTMLQSVGIIINYEAGSGESLKNYIKQFYDPICTTVSQFNIIFSADATAQMNQLQKSLKLLERTIPIHYIFTGEGRNAQFRLIASSQSKAELYFVSSMNIIEENCQFIQSLIFLIQHKDVSGLIGLIGQHDSTSSVASDLTKIKNQFAYTRQTPQHFAMVQNIRIISRHIIQLSQSNISQISKMRELTTPVCEEVFLNFVISHFYPELRPSYKEFSSSLKSRAVIQDSDKKKSKCLRSYIDILGYLPVFYNRKDFTKELWRNPNIPEIIELKKKQLISYLKKQKQGARVLQSSSSAASTQKESSFDTFSLDQQEIILNVLKLVSTGLVILILLLITQHLLLIVEEQRNRSQ